MKLTAVGFAALLVLAACSRRTDGPPQIVVDRTSCSHCGMLISEPLYAAAYQAPEREARVFDDIGCLLDAVRQETGGTPRFWFHDATDGSWIEGAKAVFVASSEIRTPMRGGFIAFGDEAAAAQAAHKYHGERLGGLPALLAHKRGQP